MASKEGQVDVKALYYIMQSMEGKLGGGEGIEGLYGSITRSGMQKVLDSLVRNCHLCNDSHIVDVGAGLGRPLLHALVSPGVASGFGIEIDKIKCNKAAAFLSHSVKELAKRTSGKSVCVPKIKCSSIEKIASLDPGTHAYSFWEGVPVDAKCAFGSLFCKSSSMQSVAVVQRAMRGRDPAEEMKEMGFGSVQLLDSFAVSMSGSGRSFTAYIFRKRSAVAPVRGDVDLPATPDLVNKKRDSVESSSTRVAVPMQGGDTPQAIGKLLSTTESSPQLALPATPSPLERQSTAVENATPTASRISGAVLNTPKSSGVSGRPQRIQPQETHAQGGERPMQSHSKSKATEGARRSSRLRNPSNAAPRMKEKTSPAKSATKPRGVQKPKSPVKNTLEAAGFRSKRGATIIAKQTLKFSERKTTIETKGLGEIHEVQ